MTQERELVEVEDLWPKIELAIKTNSFSLFDLCRRANMQGTRWDYLVKTAKTSRAIRVGTLRKLSGIFSLPLGSWLWDWERFKKYIEGVNGS